MSGLVILGGVLAALAMGMLVSLLTETWLVKNVGDALTALALFTALVVPINLGVVANLVVWAGYRRQHPND